jgi:hypothetical protein
MQELDRVAAVLKPTEKMLTWINHHAESEETYTLDDISTDCTVVLLPAFDDEEEAEHYLLEIFDELFASELMSWNENPTTWPEDRSIEMFLEWFDIDFHSLVYDVAELISQNEYRSHDEPRILQ